MCANITRALKITPLVEDDLKFLFDRLRAQQVIECLTAGYAVVVIVLAAVGDSNQMFDGCFCLRQLFAAEEALAPLGKQDAV